MGLKLSFHIEMGLSWLVLSVDKDTGHLKSTWRARSPVVYGLPMTSRWARGLPHPCAEHQAAAHRQLHLRRHQLNEQL